MSVFALPAVRAAPTRKEQTDILHSCSVGACEPRVAFNVTSGLRFGFTENMCKIGLLVKLNSVARTLSNCLLDLLLPICYTKYLERETKKK